MNSTSVSTMLTLPPNLFYGKRSTRAQAKVEPVRALASKNSSTTKASKVQEAKAGPSQTVDSSVRQLRSLRSAPNKSSKKANEAAPRSTPVSPVLSTQRTLRTRRNATHEDLQESCKTRTRKSLHLQSPSEEKTKCDNVITPLPVYKQALPKAAVGTELTASAADEYEFQVETPEGLTKKSKKRQPRQKNKMQTLWGMNMRTATKPKPKPLKRVIIQEPENLKQVSKVIQPVTACKDVLPSLKKTPPLQERAGNTIYSNTSLLSESQKKENCVNLPSGANKSANEGIPKQLAQKNKQADQEAKENNPLIKKKNTEASVPVLQPTSCKKRKISVQSNCTTEQSLTSSVIGTSPTGGSGMTPAINNMSVMFSPIHGSAKTNIQSLGQSHKDNFIHASTPVPLRSNKNSTDIYTCSARINRRSLPAAISICAEESAQCVSTAENLPIRPLEDSEDNHSSGTQSDFEDSQDLFDPDILQDIQNDGKPSIPNRLLGGRKPTMFRGSKLSQVNGFRRQGPEQIVPVDKTESCWRIGSTTKYIYSYEPTLDDCFGFDNGPDAYAINVNPVRQPIVQRRPYVPPARLPPPTPEKQSSKECHSQSREPVPQPEKSGLLSQTKLCPTFKEPTTSLTDTRIDEMLSRSISRLRRKRQHDSTIFNSITSSEDGDASSSSQQSDVREDSLDSSKQAAHLFEDPDDNIFKSPFIQPPRRSYAHLRPLKSIYKEDEENDEPDEEQTTSKISKSNKTLHKRKKMVQTTLLNKWAHDLSSHFAEVDNIELITE